MLRLSGDYVTKVVQKKAWYLCVIQLSQAQKKYIMGGGILTQL